MAIEDRDGPSYRGRKRRDERPPCSYSGSNDRPPESVFPAQRPCPNKCTPQGRDLDLAGRSVHPVCAVRRLLLPVAIVLASCSGGGTTGSPPASVATSSSESPGPSLSPSPSLSPTAPPSPTSPDSPGLWVTIGGRVLSGSPTSAVIDVQRPLDPPGIVRVEIQSVDWGTARGPRPSIPPPQGTAVCAVVRVTPPGLRTGSLPYGKVIIGELCPSWFYRPSPEPAST